MNKIIMSYLLIFLFSSQILFSQKSSNTILFVKTVDNSKFTTTKGIGDNKALLKTSYYTLHYNDSLSVFKEFQKNLDDNDNIEGLFFLDLRTFKANRYFEVNNKKYYLAENIKQHKWRITNESKKILNFTCFKAVTSVPRRNSSNKKFSLLLNPAFTEIVVWFTNNIPIPIGPSDFYSLPGAILEVSIDNNAIQFQAIQIKKNTSSNDFKVPQNHVLINEKQYVELIVKQLKNSIQKF